MTEKEPTCIVSLQEENVDSGLYKLDGQYHVTTEIKLTHLDGEHPVRLTTPVIIEDDDVELVLFNITHRHALYCRARINETLDKIEVSLFKKIEERIHT